jgi:hypothetical protein
MYLSIGQWARNQMQVIADPKTRQMMVEVRELMGVTDVYKPREEQKSVEATRQTQKDMEQATEQL